MELNVTLIEKGLTEAAEPRRPKYLRVQVDPDDTVDQLEAKVRSVAFPQACNSSSDDKSDPPSSGLRLILAGRRISGSGRLAELLLSPGTRLHAVVQRDGGAGVRDAPVLGARVGRTFYCYCKKSCNALQRSKLRVRCANCQSEAVELDREPQGWADVLTSKQIACDCDCDPGGDQCTNLQTSGWAQFYFKCVPCADAGNTAQSIAIPLSQVRANTHTELCDICSSIDNPVVDFRCDHEIMFSDVRSSCVLCVSCFAAYVDTALAARRFRLVEGTGYTLACPTPGCTGFITDAHHFHLAGDQTYAQYQTMAAESVLFERGQRFGFYCPRADCGAAIVIDEVRGTSPPGERGGSKQLVMCPACSRCFCCTCRFASEQCVCAQTQLAGGDPAPLGQGSSASSSHDILHLRLLHFDHSIARGPGAPMWGGWGGCSPSPLGYATAPYQKLPSFYFEALIGRVIELKI